jgi:hypothetical protein
LRGVLQAGSGASPALLMRAGLPPGRFPRIERRDT